MPNTETATITAYKAAFEKRNGRPVDITLLDGGLVMIEGRGSPVRISELQEMTMQLAG